MKKIILLIMLISSVVKAQTFNFSCTGETIFTIVAPSEPWMTHDEETSIFEHVTGHQQYHTIGHGAGHNWELVGLPENIEVELPTGSYELHVEATNANEYRNYGREIHPPIASGLSYVGSTTYEIVAGEQNEETLIVDTNQALITIDMTGAVTSTFRLQIVLDFPEGHVTWRGTYYMPQPSTDNNLLRHVYIHKDMKPQVLSSEGNTLPHLRFPEMEFEAKKHYHFVINGNNLILN